MIVELIKGVGEDLKECVQGWNNKENLNKPIDPDLVMAIQGLMDRKIDLIIKSLESYDHKSNSK